MSTGFTFRKTGKILAAAILLAVIGLGIWMVVLYFQTEAYLRQAEKALEKQRYAEALSAYEQALKNRPNSAQLHLQVARTARRNGEVLKAREHLTRCREIQGGVTDELQLEEYLFRAQTGELPQVLNRLLPYLIQEGPQTPLVLEVLVRVYIENYQIRLAWRYLTRWLELEPNNVEALFRRGVCHAMRMDHPKAKADYRRAVEFDPHRTVARLALAELFKLDNELAEAKEQFEAVIAYEPNNTIALLGLARSCCDFDQLAEARKYLDAIPPENDQQGEVALLRGLVEMKDRQFELAVNHFREALKLEPRLQEAAYNLMLTLTTLGRTEEARQQKKILDQINQDQARLLKITSEELVDSPNNPQLICELGEIFFRFAQPKRAVHWLKRALEIDPACKRAHQRLLEYYEEQDRDSEQAEFHRFALQKLQ